MKAKIEANILGKRLGKKYWSKFSCNDKNQKSSMLFFLFLLKNNLNNYFSLSQLLMFDYSVQGIQQTFEFLDISSYKENI